MTINLHLGNGQVALNDVLHGFPIKVIYSYPQKNSIEKCIPTETAAVHVSIFGIPWDNCKNIYSKKPHVPIRDGRTSC